MEGEFGDSGPPRVSVVVSTYQRSRLLPQLVRALEAQTLDAAEFEVVIAENGCTDDTATVLDELQRESPLAITVVHADRNRGAAAGRNLAWRAARAEVVAFTDDDCQPQPKWLEVGLGAMERARIVVGRTAPPPEQEPLTAGPFARTLRVNEPRFFETCNVFYRRADLDSHEGFETGFGIGGEDTDLALRVVSDGGGDAVVFAEDAVVHHDVRPSDFMAAVRETLRWTNIPLVVRRHPEVRSTLLHRRLFWREAHPTALLAALGIGLFVARRRPLSLLLTVPWVRLRVTRLPLTPGPRRRWVVLPGALAIDLLEVAVMLRGSLRHRTLVL